MSLFLPQALKFIAQYRKWLKRQLSSSERINKIKQLGLRPASIKRATPAELLEKLHQIKYDMEEQASLFKVSYYSGFKDFYLQLSAFLTEHSVDKGEVLHIKQTVAHRLVEAIQLAKIYAQQIQQPAQLPEAFKDNLVFIHRFGENHQVLLLKESLKNYRDAPWFNHIEQTLTKEENLN